MNDNQNKRWNIDKKISFSHILTTIAMVAGLFSWGGDVEKRLATNEITIKYQERYAEDYANSVDKRLSVMQQDLREIRNALVKQK